MNFGEHQLVQRIKERFPHPEFATLANVATPSGTYADAVAVNLWRSRGYEVVGFECKSARGDWLREKKDPAKAEGVAQYCNTFWIVANEGVVKLDELPLGWGLMEPQGKGLIARQKAKPLDHRRELTVPFMVNLIRRALEKGEMREELNAARESGRQAGIEEAARRAQTGQEKELRAELERWKAMSAEFKTRTGIELSSWTSPAKLAAIYRLVDRAEWVSMTLRNTVGSLKHATKDVEKILADFNNGEGRAEA